MSVSTPAQRDASEGRGRLARGFVRLFLTLRGRLLLLVGFAMVPALLFIFFVASWERQSVLAQIEEEARHLGALATHEHADQLEGARRLLDHLGGSLACGSRGAVPACPPHLPALLSGFPQLANIGVADARGDVVCSAAPLARPVRLAGNTAFVRALSSSDVETGTYTMGFVGRPVLHLARALRDADGGACAVLFVAVDLGWLDALARRASLPEGQALLITDAAGRVLSRSGDVADADGGAPAGLAGVLGRPHGAVLEMGLPPTPRYFVAAAMQELPGIFVVASLPYARVLSAANRAFYRTLLGLVAATAIAIAAALVAAELSVFRVLRGLIRTVRRLAAGDLSARAPLPGGRGELRELALAFGTMADALQTREREAREAQDRLRALSHRLQIVRDEEAGRIARELHDELGQILTGLKMQLVTARRVCASMPPAGDEAIAEMSEQIDHAIDSVRRISSELRPPVLDRLGLTAAVDWLVRDFEARSGIAAALSVTNVEEPVNGLVSTTLFRIVQEALTNVLRHAGASTVAVELAGGEEGLRLAIHDDGKGIDPGVTEGPRALGILGMRERVRLLGGSWRMGGAPGRGITIEVKVPRQVARAAEPVAGGAAP